MIMNHPGPVRPSFVAVSTSALRQVKRVLSARARRGLASPSELRRLAYTRRILSFRRSIFEHADDLMGDPSP